MRTRSVRRAPAGRAVALGALPSAAAAPCLRGRPRGRRDDDHAQRRHRARRGAVRRHRAGRRVRRGAAAGVASQGAGPAGAEPADGRRAEPEVRRVRATSRRARSRSPPTLRPDRPAASRPSRRSTSDVHGGHLPAAGPEAATCSRRSACRRDRRAARRRQRRGAAQRGLRATRAVAEDRRDRHRPALRPLRPTAFPAAATRRCPRPCRTSPRTRPRTSPTQPGSVRCRATRSAADPDEPSVAPTRLLRRRRVPADRACRDLAPGCARSAAGRPRRPTGRWPSTSLEETYETIEAIEALDHGGDSRRPAGGARRRAAAGLPARGDRRRDRGLRHRRRRGRARGQDVRRNPHVFGDVDETDPARINETWEAVKAAEKQRAGCSTASRTRCRP